MDEALAHLASDLHLHVAERAPEGIFVHAGVVGWRGRALLLPGSSLAGKTTLVEALLEAGATYYSDEYAVLDAEGRVEPYPRPLSVRTDGEIRGRPRRPETYGAAVGEGPLPVGMVALTRYEPGARWTPEVLSPGRGALAILEHTVPARRRPGAALATLRRVVRDAPVLRGARGDARETATELLAAMEAAGDEMAKAC